jgi:hypothetical protein
MAQRRRFGLVLLALVPLLVPLGAAAQEPRPGQPSKFDQAQCLREAERVGRDVVDRFARAMRESEAFKELEAASAKAKEMLRDLCAAGGVLASEEARVAAEKMVEAAIVALRSMRAALEDFYGSLSQEQKRKLDKFIRPLKPGGERLPSEPAPDSL